MRRERGRERRRKRNKTKWRSDGICMSLASDTALGRAYLRVSGNMLTSIHRTQQSRWQSWEE